MRKQLFLPLLALAVIFTGCEKEKESETVSISLEKAEYVLKDSPVAIKLKSTYKGAATDISFTLGGTAVKDTDYTVSADKFVVGGDAQVLEITLSPAANFDANKELTLTLGGLPSGVVCQTPKTTVTVEPRDKITTSFTVRNMAMNASAIVTVALYDSAGKSYTADADIVVPLKIDATAGNTAILGEHFQFEGAPQVVIAKGKSQGSTTLKWLKTEIDKDVFYLTIDWGKNLTAGQYDQLKVTILGSYGDKITGEWTLHKEVTNKQYFIDEYYGFLTVDGFGAADPEDKIVIDGNTFKAEMKSFYKDYFAPSAEFTLGEELILRVGMTDKRTLQLLVLSGVNRYFSPTVKSEDNVALVGVRVINDPENESVELLDVYILDYEPKAFFPEFWEWGSIASTKPAAPDPGVFLNLQYKKVTK